MARHSTGRLRLAVLLVTLMSLLMLPLQASAAPKGSNLTADIDTVTPVVSPGGEVRVTASFTNHGPSTLNHVLFKGVLTHGTFSETDARCEYAEGEVEVVCELGKFVKDDSVELVFFVEPDAEATEVLFSGNFESDARRGNPGARFDTFDGSAHIDVNGSSKVFGSWVRSHAAGHKFATLTGDDQISEVEANQAGSGYYALIEQTDAIVDCVGDSQFGEAVEVSVDTGVTVTLRYRIDSLDQPLQDLYWDENQVVHEDPDGAAALIEAVSVVHVDDDNDCTFLTHEDEGFAGSVEIDTDDVHWLVIVVDEPTNGVFKGF